MSEAPEFLTVRELAALLRLKERKIYDLAASGAVPCSRATGRLLFPAAEIRAWIEGSRKGGGRQPTRRPPVLLGSHDPLLDWAIRASGSGLATLLDGSRDGLDRFLRGEGMAAGLHIHDAGTESWNIPAVSETCEGQDAALVSFASRKRGLVIRMDGPRPAALDGLAGLRLAPRQPGSGTDTLLRALAAREGLDLADLILTDTARTETESVEAVKRGDADATLGLESVARLHELAFVPLIEERFDLLVDRSAWFEAPLQRLMAFCRSDTFRDRAAAMGGYDISFLGEVRWNA